MIINNNIPALNTHRMLTMNNSNAQKAMEKLSSGLRINRAGDDAAGLAISEKMRGQIRGLDMASKNAQDGISLIQTAEGALNESHSILQRMRELAVQASSDTNTDADRAELQKEVDQLAQELSRIAETTEFNTQELLDGSFSGTFHIGANEGQNISLSIGDMSAETLGVAGETQATYQLDVSITEGQANDGSAADFSTGTYTIIAIDDYEGTALNVDNIQSTDVTDVTHVLVDSSGEAVGTSENGTDFHAIGDVAATGGGTSDGTRANFTVANGVTEVEITATDAATVTYSADLEDGQSLAAGEYTVVDDNGLQLQDGSGNVVAISSNGADWTTEDSTPIFTTNSLSSGDTITIGAAGIDISSQTAADGAITTIQSALDTVSAERSKLGAYQNRLEHTINNLGTSAENLQAAESRIRDVDYAPAA